MKRTHAFFVFLAFVALYLPSTALAQSYTVRQLTDNRYADIHPSQNSAGQVVWQGFDGNDDEIFFWDGATTHQLTDNAYDDYAPQINNAGQVVWTELNGLNAKILLKDGADTILIASGEHGHMFPALNAHGQVVYSAFDGSDWEIFFWDGTGTIQVSDNIYDDRFHPQINDAGHVVYSGGDSTDSEIFLWNGTSTIQLSDDTAFDNSPAINSAGQVVWSANDGNSIAFWDGASTSIISNEAFKYSYPKLNSSGHIVWQGNGAFYWDGSMTTNISPAPEFSANYIHINDAGQVVWINFDQTEQRTIFVWDGVSTTQITRDDIYANYTSINEAGQVVWYGYGSKSNEIYIATPVCTEDCNNPPTAVAGANQSIHAGASVVLDGSGSHDDRTPTENLQFDWAFNSVPAGSTATLNNAATLAPDFIADLPGTYEIQLTVTDSDGTPSIPSMVTVSSLNTPPNADAGSDRGSYIGNTIVLDGSASSDSDNDPLTFSWVLVTQPVGSAAALTDADTATPELVPDLSGIYTVELTVNDGYVNSLVSTVTISVIPAETSPQLSTANALNIVTSLKPVKFTTQGNQTSLGNFMQQAIKHIQGSNINQAKKKLIDALERTDGCALRGTPDLEGGGNDQDYVSDCDNQLKIYPLLIDALNAL